MRVIVSIAPLLSLAEENTMVGVGAHSGSQEGIGSRMSFDLKTPSIFLLHDDDSEKDLDMGSLLTGVTSESLS